MPQSSLRVARIDGGGLKPLGGAPEELRELHARLQRLIRRHLPGVTASVLAQPRPVPDSDQVDWYSDLAGQPVPLTSLSIPDRTPVRERLADRLSSLAKLAEELPSLTPEDADLAQPLQQALPYPGDDYVYVVDGEPVLTFWGHSAPRSRNSGGAGRPLSATGVPQALGSPRRGPFLWLALTLLLTAAGVGGWLWFEHERHKGLLADLDAVLATDCSPIERLQAFAQRLAELDPDASRYPDIQRRLADEMQRCNDAERLAGELGDAAGDCERLARLHDDLGLRDLTRQPLRDLSAQLDAELAVCERARGLSDRLESALGDCALIAQLAGELGTPPDDADALREVRARIDQETLVCDQAAQLAKELEANLGKCPELQRLDGRMAGIDSDRPPLAPIRERLSLELDLCVRAARYEQALAEAQTDCDLLRRLDGEMQAEDSSREPLASVRRRLDKALQACKSLDDLEQALKDAGGDCRKLTAFSKRLEEGTSKRNPMFLKVKRRVLEEMKLCDLALAREQGLAAAMGDCKALAALTPEFSTGPADDPRFQTVRTRLDKALGLCREAADLERRLASAGGDCDRLEALRRELGTRRKGEKVSEALMGRLDSALAKCRAPMVAAAPKASPDPKTSEAADKPKKRVVDTRKLCPGERPVELAPDLVIVFDASGSMSQPMSLDPRMAQVLQHGGAVGALIGGLARLGAGETRIDLAKKATNNIVSSLPNDVDVGLVLVEECPGARQIGFFSPKQRKRLMGGVYSIRPVRGTPLASGIAKAAGMVDGVKAPATIVVISDGQESCDGNPCAVAARLARSKPLLTINVVDIMGTGAGTCAARGTGGRVFTAKNAAQLKTMIRRATAEVRGPARCRKK